MSEFADKLSVLVSMEMSKAHADPELTGEIIERLLHSAAFTISIAGRGNAEAIENLLHGAEAYLYEVAASMAPVGSLMQHGKSK